MTTPPDRAPTTVAVANLLDVRYETARAVCWVAVAFEKLGYPPALVAAMLATLLEQAPATPRPGAH